MSVATTVTLSTPVENAAALQLGYTREHRVRQFVEELRHSTLLPHKHLEALLDWEREAIPAYFSSTNSEEGAEDAALALVILYHEVITPAFLEAADSGVQEALLTYRDQICCLIGLYLPHGVDCEEWIEGARAAHERSVALKTLPELVEEESARHIPQLLQAANCENMHLKGAFEGLKQHLASLNASRTQLLQEYGQKIEALSADLAAVSMEMQSPCTALSGTEKQLMELQEEQLKLIELMERLICHG